MRTTLRETQNFKIQVLHFTQYLHKSCCNKAGASVSHLAHAGVNHLCDGTVEYSCNILQVAAQDISSFSKPLKIIL